MLKYGKTYTMLRFNDLGYPERLFFKYLTAQGEIIKVQDAFGRNKLMRLKGQYVIWEGSVEVNSSMIAASVRLGPPQTNHINTVTEKIWPANDSRYLHRAKREVSQKPVVEVLDPIKMPEVLLLYRTISQNNRRD